MSAEPAIIRLFRMPLRRDPDVVLCRNRARMAAEKFGFDRQDQIRVATAVSEIARNAYRYARGGVAEFFWESMGRGTGKKNTQHLVCVIRDEGPGIANLEEVLSGSYRSKTGMGMGIAGAHRLMDQVKVETAESGTTVRLAKALPRGRSFTSAEVQAAVDSITIRGDTDVMEGLAEQNNEILFMMEEVNQKGKELSKVNEELSETNRGVVALYDELDTIYRVGHVLASKLELHDLLEAIINATTEISGAEAGMFVLEETDAEGVRTVHRRLAGALSTVFDFGEESSLAQMLGVSSSMPEALRVDDLERAPHAVLPGAWMRVRSYLALPVYGSSGSLTGAMVFGHRQPGMFTERSERILASVAVQAAVGIENARLYKSVQSASAAKDRFLAILSHELRTPLNPVFVRLSLLEENPAMPADAREDLRLIRQNLELETRLIDDLLDMTRIARGKVSLERKPVDLHSVVDAARHACSGYAREQDVEILLSLTAASVVVSGDATRLQQVFWNLMNNALKFSSPGSKVWICTENVSGNRIQVTVTDTGKGILPQRIEAIFEPFEQEGDGHSSRYGGLGLGLAICRSIVTAHHGTITAHSGGEGQGAMFTVSLDLAGQEAVAKGISNEKMDAGPQQSYRILLVDDHRDTRTSLQMLLQRRGHIVVTAATCAEARALAQDSGIQLLISDIGLPDGTGYELMNSLRGNPGMKGIAVSGFGMSDDIHRSSEAGFSAHLIKPLRIAELEKVIVATMRGTG